MNINALRDADNDAGFYAAVSSAARTWRGAVLYRSTDSGATYAPIFSMISRATMGLVVGTLGDFHGGNTVDEANTIRVNLVFGSLASVSYAVLLGGAQAALIGDEVVSFRTAVLNDDGTYTLSGFLRGRRGTEAAIATHAAGERFLLLTPETIARVPQTSGDIGQTRLYKAVTAGAALSSATAQTFTNNGAALMPYSVVQIGGGRDGAGDFLINWTRRGRLVGEWRDLVDVPLSESVEAYEVDIYNADRSTLLRTLTGLTGPTATYSAADQATDSTSGAEISVSVFQMSATVGRGYGAHALLPGGDTVAEAGDATGVYVPPPAIAATLFVSPTGSDSNDGLTALTPFLTIAHASAVAVPGDVISVADGDYLGNMTLNESGTISAPITFVSATRWGAKIKPASFSGGAIGWDNFGDYIIIDGFEIDGTIDPATGTRWRGGIRVNGEGSIVRNCHVHHIDRNGVFTGNGGSGILCDSQNGGWNMQCIGNLVHHVGPLTGSNGHHGIYFTASGEVYNNLTYANTGAGIHLWHDVNHVKVINNTSFANDTWGIIYGGGDYVNLSGPADYITVSNNICYANDVGIRELGDLGSHNVISHNLSNGNGGGNYQVVVTPHTSDVIGNPLFVDYQADGSGDYHLQAGSPARNAGTAANAPTVDYEQTARPSGVSFDLGAYEQT